MSDPSTPRRTVLNTRHRELGAKMVDFSGWDMPVQYPTGIMEEHLRTRAGAGLFDVSHMGRYLIRGERAAETLDRVLTNDAASLAVGKAQYTLFPTEQGGAVDDAYLYRPAADRYLLVVNAGNRARDWEIVRRAAEGVAGVVAEDASERLAMISLQGPTSPRVLALASRAQLPADLAASGRNTTWELAVEGRTLTVVRTGYAGEPLGYELMVDTEDAVRLWDLLIECGATAVGLGARDTLRLEAGLPLYGHELGLDPEGNEIPMYACPQARFGVSLALHKPAIPGRESLERQAAAWRRLRAGDPGGAVVLSRLIRQLTLLEPGVARAGSRILDTTGKRPLGWVTSGTVVPTWVFDGTGASSRPGPGTNRRAALLGLVDTLVQPGATVLVEVRGKHLPARVVHRLLDGSTPPYARPVDPLG